MPLYQTSIRFDPPEARAADKNGGSRSGAAFNPDDWSTIERDTEVLIVGAGFAGIYLLHSLRRHNFDCKIYEAGSDLGGTWHWNCYPGARVDTETPLYAFSIEEVWKDWTWSERFPDYLEMRAYFQHVDAVLKIKKDVVFNNVVVAAKFDKTHKRWFIKSNDGRLTHAKFLLLATGFTTKRLIPNIQGLESYRGKILHTSFWPQNHADLDLRNKAVAVVGTGATGVQFIQEASKVTSKMTVFQRTPNLCLPMHQVKLDRSEQQSSKESYGPLYQKRLTTFAGYLNNFLDRSIFEDTPQQRNEFFERLWKAGGFKFWIANYKDVLVDPAANKLAYDFWARKTRARIQDPVKRDILAPLNPPHPWGTKRPCLEHDYYEQLSKPENTVIDLNISPISEFTDRGIVTADGIHREFDIIVLATSFDALTGCFTAVDLQSTDGSTLMDKWADGVQTYLGTSMAGFPNLFFLFAVHGPTASNGPSCIELQGNWIVAMMRKLRRDGITYIEPTAAAERQWTQHLHELSKTTLMHHSRSWYTGANVPGNPVQPLLYWGGVPLYEKACNEVLDNDYVGFSIGSG